MTGECRVTLSVNSLFRIEEFNVCGDVAKYKVGVYKNDKCVAILDSKFEGKTQVEYIRSHKIEVDGDYVILLDADSRVKLRNFSST